MFVAEDGTGLANANSYVSVGDADDYFEDRGNDAWLNLDQAVKEQLLIKATDYIEATYYGKWVGCRKYSTQALSWPRVVALSVGIPNAIKQATAELAFIANATSLLPTVTRGKKSVKVGPISVEYDGDSNLATDFVAASVRIAPFLIGYSGGGINSRVIRT